MQANFENISIRGISTAIPKNTLLLSSLGSKFGDHEVLRIMKNTGINSLRVAPPSMKCSDLCAAAANDLLEKLNIDPMTLDAIIFVSQTPDFIAPPTSTILQHKLGMNQSVAAFDINYGCSGYVYGLLQAALLIKSGCSRVLICAGDVITPFLAEDDRQLRMVLGDAASATIVECGHDNLTFSVKTDGSWAEHLTAERKMPRQDVDGFYQMNGSKVMEFALREVPTVIDEILALKKWNKEDVGTYIFHQPNKFMLDYLRKKTKLSINSVPIEVENVGNTGPASIPLTLALAANKLTNTDLEKVILCGFGVGLSWGACAANLMNTLINKTVEI
jgi:3-oxoacyl-[acyl-carrier-protein] synthase-3